MRFQSFVRSSPSATRATAQDRLAYKLEEYRCISDVQPGAVRDRNGRSAFDMSLSHSCFTGDTAIEDKSSAEPKQEEDAENGQG